MIFDMCNLLLYECCHSSSTVDHEVAAKLQLQVRLQMVLPKLSSPQLAFPREVVVSLWMY